MIMLVNIKARGVHGIVREKRRAVVDNHLRRIARADAGVAGRVKQTEENRLVRFNEAVASDEDVERLLRFARRETKRAY